MNRTKVNEEHMKALPKRIVNAFNAAINSLSQLQRGTRYSIGVTSRKYNQFRLAEQFFNKEVAKIMNDIYLEIALKGCQTYRFEFQMLHHISIIELTILCEGVVRGGTIWGGPESWIEIGEIKRYDLYDEATELKERLSALLNWRAAFAYYSSAKMNQTKVAATVDSEIDHPF